MCELRRLLLLPLDDLVQVTHRFINPKASGDLVFDKVYAEMKI